MTITGKELMDMGFDQGAELGNALAFVNEQGLSGTALYDWVQANKPAPKLPLQDTVEYQFNLIAENTAEADNIAKVRETMDVVMQTPTVRAGAIMPDACPAGPVGTIPVGGFV